MKAYLLLLKLFQERGCVIGSLLREDGEIAARIQTAGPERARIYLEEAAQEQDITVCHYSGGIIDQGLGTALRQHQERLGYVLTGFNKTKPPKSREADHG